MAVVTTAQLTNRHTGSMASITNETDGTATFVANSTGFVAAHVDRIIWMSTGDQRGEFRKILSVTNGTTVVLDAPFDRHPFRAFTRSNGTAFPAANPVANDQFIVSVPMSEIADTDADITQTGDYFVHDEDANMFFQNGVIVFDENITLDHNSFRWFNADQSAFIFGYVNGNGTAATSLPYSEGGCTIIDRAVRDQLNPGVNRGGGDIHGPGDFHMNGCNFIGLQDPVVQAGRPVGPFWRLYRDNDQIARIFETRFSGWFSCRLRGETSFVIECSKRGGSPDNVTDLQFINPTFEPGTTSFFGLVQDVEVQNTTQGIYWWFAESGAGEVSGVSGSQIEDQMVLFNTVTAGDFPGEANLTIRNSNFTDLEAAILDGGFFWRTFGSQNGTNKELRLENSLQNSIQNADLSAVTGITSRYAQEDNLNNQIAVVDETDGTFAAQNLRLDTIELPDAAGTGNIFDTADARSTQNAPYQYAIHTNGRLPIYRTTQLRAPENNTWISSIDVERTVLDTATVEGYSTLETVDRAYDFQSRQRFLSPYVPAIQTDYFSKSGTTLTTIGDFVFDRDATTPLSVTGTTVTMNVGSGEVFTGTVNAGTNNIALDSVTIDGNMITSGTVSAPNLEATNHETPTLAQMAFTGTLTGAGTLTVDVANSTTLFLILADHDDHAFEINNTGNGTLTIVGATEGYYSSDTSGTLRTDRGITIANGSGTVNAEPQPAPVANQPVQFMVDVTAIPTGAQWALWPGLTRTGNPLVSGVRDGSTTIAFSENPTPPTGFVNANNLAGDWVIGYTSTSHQATFFPFNVPPNMLQTDVAQFTTVVTPLAPADQSDSISLTADLTNANGDTRSITIPTALNNNRIEFDVENCPIFDPPDEAATQRMMAEARGASQFYLRNSRAILNADFTVGTVVRRDVMQFTAGAVNVRFGDYIFSDTTETGAGTGLQEVAGVYDTTGDNFAPRPTERDSRNITAVDQNTDSPHVISALRRIGLTQETLEAVTTNEVTSIINDARGPIQDDGNRATIQEAVDAASSDGPSGGASVAQVATMLHVELDENGEPQTTEYPQVVAVKVP